MGIPQIEIIELAELSGLVDYARAELNRSHVDRGAVDAALAAIVSAHSSSDDLFDTWDAVDEQIGLSEDSALRQALVSLRGRYLEGVFSQHAARLDALFKQDAEAGWRAWLQIVAEAASRFRLQFGMRLCEHPFPFAESRDSLADAMGDAVRSASTGAWIEASDMFDYCASQAFLPTVIRAHLNVLLGQVALYHADDPARAKERFDAALALATEEAAVLSSLGDYWANAKAIDEARSYYERSIDQAVKNPRSIGKANGYVGMGETYEGELKLDLAEEWYRKAINCAAGDSLGYSNLIRLYGRSELFESRQDDIRAILERVIAVDPENAYTRYCDVGSIYVQNGRPEEAEAWYTEALALEQANWTATSALEEIADQYRDRGESASAIRILDRLLESRGESYRASYHNRLGNLAYASKEFQQAADQYQRAIEAAPTDPVLHRNLALACREMKDYRLAEGELANARMLDGDESIFNREMSLVCNAEANDRYADGDYRKAIDNYQKAIAFNPGDAVLHSNLASAWLQLREPGKRVDALNQAITAYRKAQQIDPSSYAEKYATTLRRMGVAERYGERAIDWVHSVTPLRVEVSSNLISLVEGSQANSLTDVLFGHITAMRGRIEEKYGLKVPGISFRGNEGDRPFGDYIISLMEVPLVSGHVDESERFFPGAAEDLKSIGLSGTEAKHPLTGEAGFWINEKDWSAAESAGGVLWDVVEYIVWHLQEVIEHNVTEFLGHQEVAEMLATLVEPAGTGPLGNLRESPQKFSALVSLCRALVAEGVPIKPFAAIYEIFDRLNSGSADLLQIVESIRSSEAICPQLLGNDRAREIVELGPSLAAEIRGSIYRNGDQAVLAMEPERCQEALSAFREALERANTSVVVVDEDVLRPHVKSLIEIEFPRVPVLSRRELRSDHVPTGRQLAELEEAPDHEAAGFDQTAGAGAPHTNLAITGKVTAPESGDPSVTLFVHSSSVLDKSAADDQPLADLLSLMQEGLFYELGILVPGVRVEIDKALPTDSVRFRINNDTSEIVTRLSPDEFLVNETVGRLRLLGLFGRQAVNPGNGAACAIVENTGNSLSSCKEAGLTTWGAGGYVVLALSGAIRKRAATFQTVDITKSILATLSETVPELVKEVQERFTAAQLCQVLRNLLDEEISIRDMRSILEGMLSVNGTTDVDLARYIVFVPSVLNLCPLPGPKRADGLSAEDYSNFVRTCLKRYISYKYTQGNSTLVVHLLDPEIERKIVGAATKPLTLQEIADLNSAFSRAAEAATGTARNPVVLTTTDVRLTVRRLIEKEHPDFAVVGYQELSPDLNIQPISRISWS